jgi:hypothetical protein
MAVVSTTIWKRYAGGHDISCEWHVYLSRSLHTPPPSMTQMMQPSEGIAAKIAAGIRLRTYQILLKTVTFLAPLLFSYPHLTRSTRISHRTRLPALAPPSHTGCVCVIPPPSRVTGGRCPSSLYPFIALSVSFPLQIAFPRALPSPPHWHCPPTFASLVPRRILPLRTSLSITPSTSSSHLRLVASATVFYPRCSLIALFALFLLILPDPTLNLLGQHLPYFGTVSLSFLQAVCAPVTHLPL